MPEDTQEAPAPELDSQELVRVKLPNGAEATVGRSFAVVHELVLLDEPATVRGHALDATPPESDAPEAPVEDARRSGAGRGARSPRGRRSTPHPPRSAASRPVNTQES